MKLHEKGQTYMKLKKKLEKIKIQKGRQSCIELMWIFEKKMLTSIQKVKKPKKSLIINQRRKNSKNPSLVDSPFCRRNILA
jgi:hypothetical protein